MKIAVLGGGFDPPHTGHLIVIQQIKEYLKMDQIWLMPCADHPFAKPLSPALQRLEMVKLLENDYIKASAYEIKKHGVSYSIDTLKDLTKKYPEHIFYWCIGSDLLADFNKWKDWGKIITDYNVIVYPRGCNAEDLKGMIQEGFQIEEIPKNISLINFTDTVITNISSTLIRKRIAEGKNVEYIVPKKVADYIYEHKFFRN